MSAIPTHRGLRYLFILLVITIASSLLLFTTQTNASPTQQLTYPIKINFQSDSATDYADYLTDGGLVFGDQGNGYFYGWSEDVSSYVRDRNSSNSSNEAYDTLIHMSHNNGLDATWEIELPNGDYIITLAMGDPSYGNNQYNLEIEGQTVVSGTTYHAQRWLEASALITISDGRLTLSNGAGTSYQKINFIEIEQAPAITLDYTQPININFQPIDAPEVAGYLVDSGGAFAVRENGYSYGWQEANNGSTYDHDEPSSPDQLHDTVIDMQTWRDSGDDYWEIELPDGYYQVRMVVGDTTNHTARYSIELEGVQSVESGWTNGQAYDRETLVMVTDGRLTLTQGATRANNRLAFIEIIPQIPPTDPVVNTGNSDFLDTFATSPTPPQKWSSLNWDWTVQVGNNPTTMETMAADYNSDCSNANSIHTISSLDDVVYSCDERLLTAVYGESNGVGSDYGMVYLTPNRIISPTQNFAIDFDVSTRRTNLNGDWIEFWLMPYDNHLISPTDAWRSTGQGYPEKGMRFTLNNQNYWSVEIVDGFQDTNLSLNNYDQLPTSSVTELSHFRLERVGNTLRFGLPEEELWWFWDTVPAELDTWGDTIVTFGHHSYSPDSNCGSNCGPNTWHWDNVSITPSQPFGMIQPDKTVVSASDSDHTFNFGTAAPDDQSYLRFMAVGHDIELSFDNGLTWITPTLQLTDDPQNSNHFRYYWTPIPRDVDQVEVRGTNWWNGDWVVREMSIWSKSYLWPTSLEWEAEGGQNHAYFGYNTATAGDVNDDGFDDILVGSYGYDGDNSLTEYNIGRVSLYYGSPTGLELEPRWVIEGNRADGAFGYGVSTAGDVNGDGYDDIIIGERSLGAGMWGKAFIYYGSESGLTESFTELSDGVFGSRFGQVVAAAGDIDQDGFDDILISAPRYSDDTVGQHAGRVYLYYGSASGIDETRDPWFVTGEQSESFFGDSLAAVDNLDGDSFPDILIGAYGYTNIETFSSMGRVYAFYNTVAGLDTTPDWTFTGEQNNGELSARYGVADAGDVNNDGFGDVIIGDQRYTDDQSREGRAIVFFGSTNGLGATERTPDWQVTGQYSNSAFGWSVAGLGDINADGFDDIGVGGDEYTQYGDSQSGRVAIFYGSATGPSTIPEWNMARDREGSSNNRFGHKITSAGDVDGDQSPDVLVAEFRHTNVEIYEGRVTAYLAPQIVTTPAVPRSLAVGRVVPSVGYVGSPIPYQIEVTNTDLVTATNIVVTATLPSNGTYLSGGTWNGSEVNWTIPEVGPGQTAVLDFSVTADAPTTLVGGAYGAVMVTSVYTVTDGVTSTTDTVDVVQPVLPIASFSANPITGTQPLSVTFSNNSTNAISYTWSFGDGNSSQEISPIHTYTQTGTFTVTLTAYGINGLENSQSAQIQVSEAPSPVSVFTATPISGTQPLTVSFSNNSTNAISYLWDFGDNTTSQEASPTHVYTSSGIYTVTLTASGIGSLNDISTATINVNAVMGWQQIETMNAPILWGESLMAYEPVSQTVWLYGRNAIPTWPPQANTWRLTGNSWNAISSTQTPNSIYGGNLAAIDGGLLLFGGYDNQDSALAETWALVGEEWQPLVPTTTPSARGGAASAGDGISQMWIFGGQNRTVYFNDLWLYDSGTADWSLINTATSPPPRANSAMTYVNGELWLFGGRAPDGSTLNDLWIFGGGVWAEIPTNAVWPNTRQRHSFVYQASDNRLVLIGGTSDAFDTTLIDTLGYDLNTGMWVEDSSLTPSMFDTIVTTYDVNTNTLVTVLPTGETWTYK